MMLCFKTLLLLAPFLLLFENAYGTQDPCDNLCHMLPLLAIIGLAIGGVGIIIGIRMFMNNENGK